MAGASAAATLTIAEEFIIACFHAALNKPDFQGSSRRMMAARALAEQLLKAVKTEAGMEALQTFSTGVSEKLVESGQKYC